MKKICLILSLLILLSGCAPSSADTPAETTGLTETTRPLATETVSTNVPIPTLQETEPPTTQAYDPLQQLIDAMTTEELVGQLFLVAPPADPLDAIETYHLGGYILFSNDFQGETPDSVKDTLSTYQNASKIPLLIAVDEEGGSVCRVSGHTAFRESRFSSPRKLFSQGGIDLLTKTEAEKCELLSNLGINVNLAPVCDITTDPNAFMYSRSLGQSPEETAQCIAAMVNVMNTFQVGSVLKHFPGYGNNTDTHVAAAVDDRSLSDLESVDLVPFQGGIDAGCGAIMISHTIINAIDNQNPATLSPAVHDYLRTKMGFTGVIMTDDLEMDAIADHYGQGEAAVLAVLAGNDILCSWSFETQYEAVLEAVNSGGIPLEQVTASVLRILHWKQQLGILP